MTDHIKNSVDELDKDLAHSWIELSDKVRDLAQDLKLKTAGSNFASEAEHLFQKTTRLCDHVEKLHADVIDLVENIEEHIPLPESKSSGKTVDDGVNKEEIQIQRESHELRNDFKDVLKALFMWVDDPKERVKGKQ